ncbi:NAD binding dehydrogenase [Balamuthia mandrillaris]
MNERPLRVSFLGAGEVNFGSTEVQVAWGHARRLVQLYSPEEVEVVSIVDLDSNRAAKELQRWKEKSPLFRNAQVYTDFAQMADEKKPHVVIIGLPPFAHGFSKNGEKECAEAIAAKKGIHMLIEKPISVSTPEEIRSLVPLLSQPGLVVSVGYMFRYSKAVRRMRELLLRSRKAKALQGNVSEDALLHSSVKAVLLRYNSAYTGIRKAMWYDTRKSGGPIVEQCTHFVDLARFIAGDIDLSSVNAYAISATATNGQLEALPKDVVSGKGVEEGLPDAYRIPRATTAIWRFSSGALGSLSHGALLQGDKYECEMEVWGDGIRIILEDPYNLCKLRVRLKPLEKTKAAIREADMEFTEDYSSDDFYATELATFIQAIKAKDTTSITSPYEDAFKTYEATWAIRESSERNVGGRL